jgi:1,4-dihydroxy-2-naphthoate polyprenyltransferase
MTLTKTQAWILSLRAKTLSAALAPVLLGLAWAHYDQLFTSFWVAFFCAGVALCLQVATNLFNDHADAKHGSDTSQRKGPLRGLQLGVLTEAEVWRAALLFAGLAAVMGFFLLLRGGWPFWVLGAASLYLCYGYTAGFLPLSRHGLGDLFVLIFFGGVATLGTYYLQAAQVSTLAVLQALQVGLLSTVLIAINNYRDLPEDQLTKKHTLAVYLGTKGSRIYITALLLGHVLLQVYWLLWLHEAFMVALVLSLLMSSVVLRDVWQLKPASTKLNNTLAKSGAHLFVYALVQSLTLLWLSFGGSLS